MSLALQPRPRVVGHAAVGPRQGTGFRAVARRGVAPVISVRFVGWNGSTPLVLVNEIKECRVQWQPDLVDADVQVDDLVLSVDTAGTTYYLGSTDSTYEPRRPRLNAII